MPKKKVTFEQAVTQLNAVVERLEDDNLSLDESLVQFEKGIVLLRSCENQLSRAEGKVRELLKNENGKFVKKVLGVTLESVTGNEAFDD